MEQRSDAKLQEPINGQIGESLVVAELGRRGIVATAFAGNVPDIDILAYAEGRTCAIQVKAWRTGTLHFDAQRFIPITFDGDRQFVGALEEASDSDLIYVFVRLGDYAGEDRFFVLVRRELQRIIADNHRAFLGKHDGIRPKNPQSTHCAVYERQLLPFKDRWDTVEGQLGLER